MLARRSNLDDLFRDLRLARPVHDQGQRSIMSVALLVAESIAVIAPRVPLLRIPAEREDWIATYFGSSAEYSSGGCS